MSLYKYGISDKTMGAMQNSDPEIQQMLENAQQNNQIQPPASNGIMDIIKELFGFGDAQSSDLGEIANLRSISDPKTPKLALEPLYPNFGAPMPMETNNPYNYAPYLDFNLDPEVNMGATGTVPKLKEGILSQVDSRFPLYDDFTVAEEGDDLEDNAVTVDELGNLKQPSGFKDFLKTMLGFAIPGAGLFMGDRSALQGIKSLNQRLRNTDFGQSRTGAEYMMRRRERKQAERAQEAMPDVYRSAKEQGFTNDRGGFSTSRADRAGTSLGSGQFNSKRSTGRQGY
jgi:hypothetical protein